MLVVLEQLLQSIYGSEAFGCLQLRRASDGAFEHLNGVF
jgi:hypothetical protein